MKIGSGVAAVRSIVEVPMTRIPDEAREIGLPDTVMAGSPGVRTVPEMVKPVGLGGSTVLGSDDIPLLMGMAGSALLVDCER